VEQVAPVNGQMPAMGTTSTSATGSSSASRIPASGSAVAPAPALGKRRWFAGLAVGLALVLAGAAAFVSHSRTSRQEISSVAVLPFVNASHDPNSEYLSDGLTESLINNLSQIPNLAVMSRSSVFHYKGRDVDLQAVAKDLKVEGVITGRIVQHGDQLIIRAELIDARTNHNLWGDQYDRKLSDVLAVQEDITRAISSKLRDRLSGETKKQVAKGGTNDPEAYQLYLKGRYYWGKRTQESLDKAKDYFNQAVEKDPHYALAYVGLADYYYVLSDYAPVSAVEVAPKARAAAQKALAIDDTLSEAHAVLAGADQNLRRGGRARFHVLDHAAIRLVCRAQLQLRLQSRTRSESGRECRAPDRAAENVAHLARAHSRLPVHLDLPRDSAPGLHPVDVLRSHSGDGSQHRGLLVWRHLPHPPVRRVARGDL